MPFQVLEGIQEAILATDLAQFFGTKSDLEKIHEDKSFDWKIEEHRSILNLFRM